MLKNQHFSFFIYFLINCWSSVVASGCVATVVQYPLCFFFLLFFFKFGCSADTQEDELHYFFFVVFFGID